MDKLIGESPVMQVVLRPAEPAFGEHQHSYSQKLPIFTELLFLSIFWAKKNSAVRKLANPCHPGHSDSTRNEI